MQIICNSLKRRKRYRVCDLLGFCFIHSICAHLILLSDLESEMYQLSHLLIEQRNILATLRDENATGDTKGILAEAEEDGE